MLPRSSLEAVSRQAMSLIDIALTEKLPDLLKSDESLADLREGFRRTSGEFFAAKVFTQKDGQWHLDESRLSAMDDNALDRIRASLEDAYKVANDDKIVTSLDAAEKTGTLQALIEAGRVLAAHGIETETSPALREAVGADEPVMHMEIPGVSLHAVANRSLGLLDTAHALNYSFGEGDDGKRAQELLTTLSARLDDADYLLPGQSTVREEMREQRMFDDASYEGQTARGTYEQAIAIKDAADELVEHLNMSKAFNDAPLDAQNATAFMRIKTGHLASALDEARPVPVREGVSLYEQSASLSPFETKEADVIISVYETAERMAERAGLDTDGTTVTVPYALFKETKTALAEFSESGTEAMFREIVETETPIPGIHNDTARSFIGMIDNLRDMMDTAEARFERKYKLDEGVVGDVNEEDKLVGVRADDMDAYNLRSRSFLDVGALHSLYVLAGRDEASILSLNEGRDSAAFGTIQEAMRGGRTSRPDEALGKMGKILPEMSRPEYLALPQAARERVRVAEVVPGQGDFKNYRSGGTSYDMDSVRLNKSRLRRVIRDNLLTEDGKPNLGFRQRLTKMARGPIVAPHRYEAEVVREEAERILDQQRQMREEQRAKFLEGADVKNLDVSASQLRKHLNVLEASGSTRPPVLAKHGDNLAIEHPDAPTITGRLDRMGSLESARDGYKLHNLDASEMRTALESGHNVIRIAIADDRPMSISGFDPKAQAVEKKVEPRKTDRMSSLEESIGR